MKDGVGYSSSSESTTNSVILVLLQGETLELQKTDNVGRGAFTCKSKLHFCRIRSY